jgi:hypothetical protein
MWRDAEENPNRGKEPKPRKPKAAAVVAKDGKENTKSKSKVSATKKKQQVAEPTTSEVEEDGEVGSDE